MGAGPSVCGKNSCGCYDVKRASISLSTSNENVRTLSVNPIPENLGWQEQALYSPVDEEVPQQTISGTLEVIDDEEQNPESADDVKVTFLPNKYVEHDTKGGREGVEINGATVEGKAKDASVMDAKTNDVTSDAKSENEVSDVMDLETNDLLSDAETENKVSSSRADDSNPRDEIEDELSDTDTEDTVIAGDVASETQVVDNPCDELLTQAHQPLDKEENADAVKSETSESENEIYEQAESDPLLGELQREVMEPKPVAPSTNEGSEIPSATPEREMNNPATGQQQTSGVKKSRSSTPFFNFFKKRKNNPHSSSDSNIGVRDGLVVIGTRIEPPADFEVEDDFVDAVISIDEVKVAEIKRSGSAKKDDDGSGEDTTLPGNQTGDEENGENPEKVFGGQRGAMRSPSKWMANWMWG